MQNAASPLTSNDSKASHASLDDLFTPGRMALVLGFLMLVTYPDIVLGSHAFFYRDAGLFGYPLAYYYKDCFWRGEMPLWNPYSNCGIPFLAQWNTLVLYPPSLFYLLLPLPWSMNFFQLGHMFLAAIGMYFLAHRWFGNRFAACVAGIAFAWNGFTLHALMWPSILASLGWMPWLILLLERAWTEGRRWTVLAGLVGAMQMLTGAPEIILITWIIAGLFLLLSFIEEKRINWNACRRFVTIVFLVFGLSAAQLLPFLQLLAHGDRSSSYGTDTWSMPAWGIANFLVPLFRCTPSVIGVFTQDEQQWTSSYYAGIAVFALAIIALVKIRNRRVILLSALSVAGILCALGSAGFILPALKKVLPILGFIRFPIKFVVISLFCFPLLATAALVWLQRQPEVFRQKVIVAFCFASLLAVAAIVAVAYLFPFPNDTGNFVLKNGLTRSALLAAILTGIFFLFRTTKPRAKIFLSFTILVLIGLDASTHMPRQNPTMITRGYESWPPQMDHPPALYQSRAMISDDIQDRMDRSAHPYPLNHYFGQRAVLLGNCNLLEKIPKINGFFPIYLHEEYEVESLLYKNRPVFLPNLADFLGVSQITSSTQLFAWNSRTNFMPFATIGQEPVFENQEDTLKRLRSSDFQPRQMVYLPESSKPLVSAGSAANARIVSQQFSTHEMSFETESDTPAILVLSQAYYPLWKPYVDEKTVPLLRANHGFQAIEIPAGRHRLRLVYEDRRFALGAAISLTTLAGCIVGFRTARKREADSNN